MEDKNEKDIELVLDILRAMFNQYDFTYQIENIYIYKDESFPIDILKYNYQDLIEGEFDFYIRPQESSYQNNVISIYFSNHEDKLKVYYVNIDSDYFLLGEYDLKSKTFFKENDFWETLCIALLK